MANEKGSPQNFESTKGRMAKLSTTERQEIARKGGIASGKAKEQKKTMQELAKMIANCKPSKGIQKQIKEIFPEMESEDITNSTLMLSKVFEKAVKDQDIKAFEVFRDTAGMKPVDKQEIISHNINEEIPNKESLKEVENMLKD
jgi:hypothetical protein